MSEETIAQRVIRVIAKNRKMAPEELSPATRFDDMKMDSLDALNMIFALEEEFDIDIPNEEAAAANGDIASRLQFGASRGRHR